MHKKKINKNIGVGAVTRSINHLSGYPLVDPLTICPGSRGFPVGGDLVH